MVVNESGVHVHRSVWFGTAQFQMVVNDTSFSSFKCEGVVQLQMVVNESVSPLFMMPGAVQHKTRWY